jgi:magnesium chelatase family protein
VAAAGAHHLLFVGAPGTGKTMLARRLPGLLPQLTHEQALEVTAIHSIAGTLSPESPLITTPPFVAPHHSTSVPALVGGGVGLAKPGAISKAHHGVLFMDEACEYGPHRLEALRTALEEGEIRLARRDGVARYPARFQLILATNPCPCAPPRELDCSCSPHARRRYLARLSGPMLDRVDLRVRMRPITAMSLAEQSQPESTVSVRARVAAARQRAAARWADRGWRTNAEVPGPVLRRDFALPRSATALLDRGLASGAVTARGADRCIRVAWTLSDLASLDRPGPDQVAAALEFRDRRAA